MTGGRLHIGAAARRLGVSTRTLLRAERDGRIVFERQAGGWRSISEEALLDAPVLRLGMALRKHDISYTTVQMYLKRAIRRLKMPITPGQAIRRYVSFRQAEVMAQGIKQVMSSKAMGQAVNENTARANLAAETNFLVALKKTTENMIDMGMFSARRMVRPTAWNRAIARVKENTAEQARMVERVLAAIGFAVAIHDPARKQEALEFLKQVGTGGKLDGAK